MSEATTEAGEATTEQGAARRGERADAARNRRAILRATEELLAECGAEHVSLDRVAAAAGVGKGTVFRRFGSRTGLFQALLADRAARLREAIDEEAAPLGTDGAPCERLLAFLDALADIAEHHLSLIAAHERACGEDKFDDPTYRGWHAHVSALVRELRPGLDAEFVAHMLLAAFDGELVRRLTADGDWTRFRRSVRDLADLLVGQGK
ncbi:transcriptional regulator, TetR family protein [Streptomyces bingchenggensis BCW-1]|uniref:Transcriptional regulator, TetR family protein n=1 Tax=Streptomyces bingchenggensis (strain BCW-1) TaxID=749414 RepID=D7C4W3_STRBB|nr:MULTISPECIES: TetR/AcrR family transcriptional regulator [Streptomyces]ADI08189.1 transcriptional regulator, TetR family protein [Streptomyces bingchenggensis BCW-1]